MSYLSDFRSRNFLILALCVLLFADICLRLFDGDPVQATRIAGRETDAAITQLAGTYYQMAAANKALASSIGQLSSQLARLDLKQWSKAEEKLAKSQELLADAAIDLAKSLGAPDEDTDSGGVPSADEEPVDGNQGEKGSGIRIEVQGQ